MVPSQPKAPSLIAATATTIQLQFYEPEDNGGAELNAFALFMNDGLDEDPTILVSDYNTNLLTHTVAGLDTGTVYKFLFRATNSVGNSQDSFIAAFAAVDSPLAPETPTVMLSHTS